MRALYQQHGVSSVLVIGGSGDYFDVADTVYSLSPSTIGGRYGYILSPLVRLMPAMGIFSPLVRLVPAMGIFSLPFYDGCPLWVYSLSPCAIGTRCGYILSPLV